MKKKILGLVSLFLLCLTLASPTLAKENIVIISDLSQHQNKKHNILIDNAAGYTVTGYEQTLENGKLEVGFDLIDDSNQPCETLPSDFEIYFWRPSGVMADSLSCYSFTIHRKDTSGNVLETYTTAGETVEAFRQYGLRIVTNKPGIFEISFNLEQEPGPSWEKLLDELDASAEGYAEVAGVRITGKNNTLIVEGPDDSTGRISSDITLNSETYSLPYSHFDFKNVELQEVSIITQENEHWTISFDEKTSICGGVSVSQYNENSYVHLKNDAIIRDTNDHLNLREFPLVVDINSGSSFHLTGKGSIPTAHCNWRTSELDDVYVEQKSALINVHVQIPSSGGALPHPQNIFKNVHLDHKQFPSSNPSNDIRMVLVYSDGNGNDGEISYTDYPAAKNLSEIDGNTVSLLLPDSHQDKNITVKVSAVNAAEDQYIAYELALVDEEKNTVSFEDGAYLYIPYPEGLDMFSAAQYDFTVTHYMGHQNEIFSTRDGTITLEPQGLRFSITSASPYVFEWKLAEKNNLPSTGDSSHLSLYAVLLASSFAAYLCIQRRKHHA